MRFLVLVFAYIASVVSVSATTIEFVPTNNVQTFSGNVTGYYGTNPGLLFTVGQPGDQIEVDAISVYIGETASTNATIGLGVYTWSNGIDDILLVDTIALPLGNVGWQSFGTTGLALPHSYDGNGRSNYLVLFSVNGSQQQGIQYRSSFNQSPTFWNQDNLNFIYGFQNGALSNFVPAVRFELATAQVPLPATLPLLFGGLGLLVWRRKAR